ncbi:MAG TPA: hypothetical protein VII37_06930 [Candidatus Acidoferrum sp.]
MVSTVGFVVINLKALQGRQSLSCGLLFEYRLGAHSENLNHGRAKKHRYSEVSGAVASFGSTERAVPTWFVRTRDAGTAYHFMHDLAGRLASRVQLTRDGHKTHLAAVEEHSRFLSELKTPSIQTEPLLKNQIAWWKLIFLSPLQGLDSFYN